MRGADVLLVEAQDFAAGASGSNHGMLHSGARYAVKDPDSARECASENRILKRVARFCVEDTGGLFVSVPGDNPAYKDSFISSCHATGVGAREIEPAEARRAEPNLTGSITAAVEVPDASIDPFFLVWGNIEAAREAGAIVLNHCPVIRMTVKDGCVEEVTFGKGGSRRRVKPEVVINAAGAWSGRIASMAGLSMDLSVDKGTMVVFNGRVVNHLVNRLRPPSDGDILVPNRTSTILGTTSSAGVLDGIAATREEVELLEREANQLVPGLASARAVRAYAGVRPLLGGSGEGRNASRTFRAVDHADEGVDNMISVVGGKLTTYRLMAEKAADLAMTKLGRKGDCRTAIEEILPPLPNDGGDFRSAVLRRKYGSLADEIVSFNDLTPLAWEEACSCEAVSRGELEYFAGKEDVKDCADLMRRTRAGMGYCQAGLCAFKLASALGTDRPLDSTIKFLGERWKGLEPVLEGEQLRQEALKAHLFAVYGIDHTEVRR
jgi:glycerol-3-phosphate dehydrogenase